MKILKIEDRKGLFLTKGGEYIEADKIGKEVLCHLVDLALDREIQCDMDPCDQELLPNQAHQIIYKSVYEKMANLMERRDEFLDQSERAFLDDYERYSNPAPQQGAQPDAFGAG